MRVWIGLGLILLGVLAGLALGIGYFFIGGIVNGVQMFLHHQVTTGRLAWDVARVVLAGAVEGVSILVLIIPGAAYLARN